MNGFGSAIDHAFELQAQHADAVAFVETLARELAAAVNNKTGGIVKIVLLDQEKTLNLGKQLGRAFGLLRPQLGGDDEDRTVRKYLIARSGTSEARALWEVEFAEAGYPVTVRGPREKRVEVCSSAADVRDAFVDAAADVRVGRKLQSLLDSGTSEPETTAQLASAAEPPSD